MDFSVVQQHNKPDDCWVIIHGKVYDVTGFLGEHPGGPAGMNCAFRCHRPRLISSLQSSSRLPAAMPPPPTTRSMLPALSTVPFPPMPLRASCGPRQFLRPPPLRPPPRMRLTRPAPSPTCWPSSPSMTSRRSPCAHTHPRRLLFTRLRPPTSSRSTRICPSTAS